MPFGMARVRMAVPVLAIMPARISDVTLSYGHEARGRVGKESRDADLPKRVPPARTHIVPHRRYCTGVNVTCRKLMGCHAFESGRTATETSPAAETSIFPKVRRTKLW